MPVFGVTSGVNTYFVGPWELSRATAILPATPAEGRILLVESLGSQAALPYHRKRLLLVLSATRHFARELRAEGFEVDLRRAESFAEGIRAHAAEFRPETIILQEPADWGPAQSIGALAAPGSGLTLDIRPDRRFLTSRAQFAAWTKGRKLLRMEDFYRQQRRRLQVLVDGSGEPVGGTWNLDHENRQTAKALRKRGLPAPPLAFAMDEITREAAAEIDALSGHWGETDGFDLPVTGAEALQALDDFLAHRLADFGPYEDAMLSGETYLYHSRLSAAMNTGLLHPREMIERTVRAFARRDLPLSSVEGFVRQIIGWREYVNGIYWTQMPAYRERNYFGFTRPLPQAYWDPDATDLACLSDSVRMVRDTAFAHHIHRLMVLCNFAVLTGTHPLRLSEWFWAGFADAWEWVELPNVVGMGTFGDGGLLGSKPYVSSAAYINRMSDYCGGCRYDPKLRTGPTACPFNYLYWTFLEDVQEREFDVGQRMALVLKQLEKIPPAEMAAMRSAREAFLAGLEGDATGWTFDHDAG